MRSINISRKTSIGLQPAIAWIAILGFISFTFLCIIAGLGKVLNLAFPLGAFAVSLLLYFRYPILYIGFVWWLWFLTPLVRRLADYRSGFTDPSPILLSPLIATLITLITLLKILPKIGHSDYLPYILAAAGVAYSYLVAIIRGSLAGGTISLLEWLAPIALSCHLFVNWQQYPSYRQNIQRVFLWCAIIAGAYGVFQYLVAPEWDRFWLINVSEAGNTSFGRPEPMQMRVWSTMHGPGVFGQAMMAVLLVLLSSLGSLSFPAIALGYLSFLLSAVRAAWLGWFVGLLSLVTSLKSKFQIRLILVILVGVMCVVPLATIEPFSDVIGSRLETFSTIQQDGSGKERQENYDRFLSYALQNAMGDGLGNNPGLLDSQILELLINFGWFGTIFYAGGFLFLLLRLLLNSRLRADTFASTARAITIGMASQIGLGSVLTGLPGIVFWGFLGIGLAAQKHQQFSTRSEN